MKPLVVRPKKDDMKPPAKEPPRSGKSGEGADSAMEHLINQERSRVLHGTVEPAKDKSGP